MRDLRRSLTGGIYAILDQIEDLWNVLRNDWLISLFNRRLQAGELDVDDFILQIESKCLTKGSKRAAQMPQNWARLCAQWKAVPVTRRRSSTLPEAIAKAALRSGMIDQVGVAARVRLTDFSFVDNYRPQTGRILNDAVDAGFEYDAPSEILELGELPGVDDASGGA